MLAFAIERTSEQLVKQRKNRDKETLHGGYPEIDFAESRCSAPASKQLATLLLLSRKYKSAECRHYAQTGRCPFGNDRCVFTHGAADSRRDPLSSYYEASVSQSHQVVGLAGRMPICQAECALTRNEIDFHPLVLLRELLQFSGAPDPVIAFSRRIGVQLNGLHGECQVMGPARNAFNTVEHMKILLINRLRTAEPSLGSPPQAGTISLGQMSEQRGYSTPVRTAVLASVGSVRHISNDGDPTCFEKQTPSPSGCVSYVEVLRKGVLRKGRAQEVATAQRSALACSRTLNSPSISPGWTDLEMRALYMRFTLQLKEELAVRLCAHTAKELRSPSVGPTPGVGRFELARLPTSFPRFRNGLSLTNVVRGFGYLKMHAFVRECLGDCIVLSLNRTNNQMQLRHLHPHPYRGRGCPGCASRMTRRPSGAAGAAREEENRLFKQAMGCTGDQEEAIMRLLGYVATRDVSGTFDGNLPPSPLSYLPESLRRKETESALATAFEPLSATSYASTCSTSTSEVATPAFAPLLSSGFGPRDVANEFATPSPFVGFGDLTRDEEL